MTWMWQNIAEWLNCQNCFHQSICLVMSCASSSACSLKYPVARGAQCCCLKPLFLFRACAFQSFLPEVHSDFIFGIPASHKLTDSLHPRFRHGLSKRQGEMKNTTAKILLCPDLKNVKNWVHLSFKQLFVVVVFPYGKKIIILQNRYFFLQGLDFSLTVCFSHCTEIWAQGASGKSLYCKL